MMKSYKKQLFMGAALVLTALACSPTYQSVRSYIPQHSKAKQLQVEAGLSQVDISYSVTDHIGINTGATFLNSEVESQLDNEEVSLETSQMMGAQLGLTYFSTLDEDGHVMFSVNAGSAFQQWNFDRDENFITDIGYNSFEASIINPFAQIGLVKGSTTDNLGVAIRYEQPIFDFQNTSPSDIVTSETPQLVNFVAQGKYHLAGQFSLFGQFVYRYNLDYDEDETDRYIAYDISLWNLYVGVSYAIDFSPETSTKTQSPAVDDNGNVIIDL